MNDPAMTNHVDSMTSAGPHPKSPPGRRAPSRPVLPTSLKVTAAEIHAEAARPHQSSGPSAKASTERSSGVPRTMQEVSPVYDLVQSVPVPDDVCLDCDEVQFELPGLVVGDCDDRTWLAITSHVEDCQECASMLHSYQSLDLALGQVAQQFAQLASTPPVFVPPITSARSRKRSAKAPPLSHAAQLKPVITGHVSSPVGPITVAVSADGVCDLSYHQDPYADGYSEEMRQRGFTLTPPPSPAEHAHLENLRDRAVTELTEYFAGQRDHFTVPVDLSGVSPFTQSVLAAASEIGFGQLTTYAGIAAKIGKPGAVRAVGNALGRNPVAVIVPCHRIVRSDWTIGGYTGGVHIKEHLLSLEGAHLLKGMSG